MAHFNEFRNRALPFPFKNSGKALLFWGKFFSILFRTITTKPVLAHFDEFRKIGILRNQAFRSVPQISRHR